MEIVEGSDLSGFYSDYFRAIVRAMMSRESPSNGMGIYCGVQPDLVLVSLVELRVLCLSLVCMVVGQSCGSCQCGFGQDVITNIRVMIRYSLH